MKTHQLNSVRGDASPLIFCLIVQVSNLSLLSSRYGATSPLVFRLILQNTITVLSLSRLSLVNMLSHASTLYHGATLLFFYHVCVACLICYEFDAHDISLITLVVSVFALFYPWFNE